MPCPAITWGNAEKYLRKAAVLGGTPDGLFIAFPVPSKSAVIE
jgi:hypothetical protein